MEPLRNGVIAVKRLVIFFLAAGFLCLTGCTSWNPLLGPKTVKIEGKTYTTGFYADDLWIKDAPKLEEAYEIGGVRFRLLDGGTFDCANGAAGGKTGGMIYVLDSQLEEARAYYADPENYVYYCAVGVKYSREGEGEVFEIEDIDLEKYDALMGIGSTFGYDPFDMVKNYASERKAVEIDVSKTDVRPYINFYRESRDGLFTSSKASNFFILDGTMYLARYHNGTKEIVSAVELPEETAAYFIDLVEGFQAD